VAAARDGTSSWSKILLTCLSMVFSLRHSSAATALFVLPVATRRSTCSSRAVNGWAWAESALRVGEPIRARPGATPRRSKTALAAVIASSAAGGGIRIGRGVVTGHKTLIHRQEHQIAAFGGLTVIRFEQALRATEPAGCAAHLAAEEKPRAQPDSTASGEQDFVRGQVGLIGTFKRPQIGVILADQIRRRC
jgi:hypothetical protein